jgi:hypothetical protein
MIPGPTVSAVADRVGVESQLRRFLLALFSLGAAGTFVELIALGHYEDQWQLVPLFVLSVALVSAGLQTFAAGRVSLRMLQIVAIAMMAAGIAGIILHYRGNLEFQLETSPDLGGWRLFTRIVHAKVPPALAPGVMAQLGLLGLIYCFRHPSSRRGMTSGRR